MLGVVPMKNPLSEDESEHMQQHEQQEKAHLVMEVFAGHVFVSLVCQHITVKTCMIYIKKKKKFSTTKTLVKNLQHCTILFYQKAKKNIYIHQNIKYNFLIVKTNVNR